MIKFTKIHPFAGPGFEAADLVQAVATATFRPFTDTDWSGFAGCTSENPLISELADGVVLIIDDAVICLVDEDANWLQFDTADGQIELV